MARRKHRTAPARSKATRGWPRRLLGWAIRLVVAFLLLSLAWVLLYRFVNPPITATMIGDMVGGRGATREWMSLERIDRDMVRAAIAAEDGKFCQHNGFDWDSIAEAARRNASGGRVRGGSTISQQTAKNAFLWQGGGYVRKAVEAWFTLLIETLWPKARIMEVYLNLAETGIGTYGVSAGAERYFGHDSSAMSRQEAARLAAVLPLPKKRGAIAPKGFTRRYGATIAARLAVVGRDRLDACIYDRIAEPRDIAPPPARRGTPPRARPGEEYESVRPPPLPAPPAGEEQEAPAEEFDPLVPTLPVAEPTTPVAEPVGDGRASDSQTLNTD